MRLIINYSRSDGDPSYCKWIGSISLFVEGVYLILSEELSDYEIVLDHCSLEIIKNCWMVQEDICRVLANPYESKKGSYEHQDKTIAWVCIYGRVGQKSLAKAHERVRYRSWSNTTLMVSHNSIMSRENQPSPLQGDGGCHSNDREPISCPAIPLRRFYFLVHT